MQYYIKQEFEEYLNKNSIINMHHHGSRKGHGTSTAISQINYELKCRYEDGKITTIVQTDLSAAFDTIDAIGLC